MTTAGKLIFGGLLVRRWNRPDLPPIENGALYAEAGRVVAIDTLEALTRRYPAAPRIGNPRQVVVPGFVNAHSHGRGLTTWQMGQADEPLESRIVEFFHRRTRAAKAAPGANARVDPYLDTLYSCAKQLASGITTTLHNHNYMAGPVEPYAATTRSLLDAYRDSGMRCAFTLAIRDCNSFTFRDDHDFVATLPAALQQSLAPDMPRCEMTLAQYEALLRELAAEYPEIAFQLGPWAPVFCSDDLMSGLADLSRRDGWRIQTHLNETRHQAAYGRRLHGTSWVRRLHEIGMLSERFSGAHGIWPDDGDIELLAETGAQIVYNPGSNLRLQSGLAPVHAMLKAGVKVAFGLDSLSVNDDDDMLQDLRVGRLIQGGHGIDGATLSAETMLEMATTTGAVVAGIPGIGSLTEGGCADAVLLSLPDMEGMPSDHPVADVLLQRGRAAHVRTVIIGGTVMIEDGRWTGRAPGALLQELVAASPPAMRALPEPIRALQAAVRDHIRRHDA